MNYININSKLYKFIFFFHNTFYFFYNFLTFFQLYRNLNNANYYKKIESLIIIKKLNSIIKKKPHYFSFFKTVKPLYLSNTVKISKLWYNLNIKNIYKNRLFLRRPFDKKKLFKRILNLRSDYRKYILHTKYDRKLTIFLSHYKKNLPRTSLNLINNSISSVLKKASFIINNEDYYFFKKNNCIFLNRSSAFSDIKIISKCDLLELFISYNFLGYLKKFKQLTLKNCMRYKFKIRDKIVDKKLQKKKEERINFKINRLNLEYLYNAFLNYEVNYYTLSIIIIKESYNEINSDIIYSNLNSLYIMRLYNWGYV